MKRRNIRLSIAFDGSNYNGWQKQKGFPSVQGCIESVLEDIFKERIILIGAGRTDKGAHAINYTANFHTHNFDIPPEGILSLLNSRLPYDIRILDVREVDNSFHSRFSAIAREYIYITFIGAEILPHFSRYVYHISRDVDLQKLREITMILKGKHNFKYFCYGYKKGERKNFERIIYNFRVKELKILNQRFLIFFIKGNGFLKGMIRTLISVCFNYENGVLDIGFIKGALSGEIDIPSKYKVPVPANGLYYKRTFYPHNF